ncbi:hypothetical protein TcWFU_008925 [Taenia crassiceps]|uniref:Uncharacterized protein n=1 Tax=Taenia crassiceps TaxID=6207 RepID=A0ABR4QT69_9CEST
MGIKVRLSPYPVPVTCLSCNANLHVIFQGCAHSSFRPVHKSGKFTLSKAHRGVASTDHLMCYPLHLKTVTLDYSVNDEDGLPDFDCRVLIAPM